MWQRAWVCFPVPCLAVLRTSVGKWCHSAFCCTCFNWRSSLAIHLGPHCLHNYHFCWLYTISSDKRICQNNSLLWTLRSSILHHCKSCLSQYLCQCNFLLQLNNFLRKWGKFWLPLMEDQKDIVMTFFLHYHFVLAKNGNGQTYFFFLISFLFIAMLCNMQDLSSPTRGWDHAPCITRADS